MVCVVPHGHWHTTTLLSGLRTTGPVAPLVLDGAMNGAAFRAYTKQVLVPVLRPGDIVVRDNFSSHKVRGAREVIEAAGAGRLDLAAYRPDLNSIEMGFSTLKRLLRDAAQRIVEELWQTIGRSLDCLSLTEWANSIRPCDFAQSAR